MAARASPEIDRESPGRRLFTALFPSSGASAAIAAARLRWPDLPRKLHPLPERMHVTLQFFNRVAPAQQQAWLDALARLRFEPFDLALVRAEVWRAPRGAIVVLRPAENAALDALHAATDELARAAGLAPERRGWEPHLTALRHADRLVLEPLAQPITWRVRAVDLIWSDLQARPPCYHRLGRFEATDCSRT